MTNPPKIALAGCAALGLALLVGACAGDVGGTSPYPTAQPQPYPTPAPQPYPTPAPAPAPAPQPYPTPTTGVGTCQQVYSCSLSCIPSDASCGNNCLAQASAAAQPSASTLLQCVQSAAIGGCQSLCVSGRTTQCTQCLDQMCASQVTTCTGLAPGSTPAPYDPYNPSGTPYPPQTNGTATCRQTLTCLNACMDDLCSDNCYNQSSAQAKQQLDAYDTCADGAYTQCQTQCDAGDAQCDTCIDQVCAAQCP